MVPRQELNQLAMEVDVATSQEGKRLAALYRSGKWPPLFIQPNPQPPPNPAPKPLTIAPVSALPKAAPGPPVVLKLNGIAMGQRPAAGINGQVVKIGETLIIPAKPQDHVIKCLKITSDSVLVSVDEESQPRELRLK